jgi:hypothetical protein
MTSEAQLTLFAETPLVNKVMEVICSLLRGHAQPSAWELLQRVEDVEPKARWAVLDALRQLVDDSSMTSMVRSFLRELLESEDLKEALQGKKRPGQVIESSIDTLLQQSAAYRGTEAFQEMISFMANFREYAPFNNMLVRLQNPSCSLYATKRDWAERFKRWLKEDAHPMIILAPKHPVMLVYDLDQTEGSPLPAELRDFGKFEGDWDPRRLQRTTDNAKDRDWIRVEFKPLSSTNAGFAALAWGRGNDKMRIAIHEELDPPSRYGVLCHELAHIYLGHLGGDKDGWWPSRGDLTRGAIEIEAEAVAYIVARRAGLSGASPQYVSRYIGNDALLQKVSLDQIAKVAGRLEEMATRRLPKRSTRKKKVGRA